MSDNHIINSVVGAIITSIGINIFIFSHEHKLNISDIFWALTSFRQKWLPEYLSLIAGIFFMSGLFFNIFGYNSLNGIYPYGPMEQILTKSSMYGFAISGFCIGLGSKLGEGDLIYHGFIGLAIFKLQSFLIVLALLIFAILWSWILSFQGLSFLTNSEINPMMQFTHLQSSNINIVLSVILIIVSSCWLNNKNQDKKIVFKKVISSFIAGLLLSLGFLICGLSRRKNVFQSLSPTSSWNPTILIFIATIIFINLIVYQLIYKLITLKNQIYEDNFLFKSSKEEYIQLKKLIGGALFGSGWGIGGLQLTSYFIHSAIFSIPVVLIFGLFLILGTMIGDTFQQNRSNTVKINDQ